jgi:hypothetical protein
LAAVVVLVGMAGLMDLAWAKDSIAEGKNQLRNLLVNPNFERTHPARRLDGAFQRTLPGFEEKAFLPSGWAVFPNRDGAGIMSVVQSEGRIALRVQTKQGQSITLRQHVEVVPEAAYACGVSIKGKGPVDLHVSDELPAPWQSWGPTRAQATDAWTKVALPVTVGVHRHFAALWIDIGENADVLLRDAEFSAPLPQGALPEDLVTTKPTRDENTLFLEDFDGPSCSFEVGKDCKLTAQGQGRFGRGLLVTPATGGAKAPLSFGKLPETGTIEFWYKPAVLPTQQGWEVSPILLQTRVPGKEWTQMELVVNWWTTTLRFGFRQEHWESMESWASSHLLGNIGWGCWQPDTWHHLAGSWDREAIRLYADGALVGVRLQGTDGERWDTSARGRGLPEGDVTSLVLPAAGVVDEIRVSKGLRYGPFVPMGVTNPPMVTDRPASAQVPAAANTPHVETSEKELDTLRAKNIAAVPDTRAAYTLSPAQALPMWEGMGGMQLLKDYFGKGADAVRLDASPETSGEVVRPSAVYWKVTDVPKGKYYLGLWMETQDDSLRTEYSSSRLLASLYLNGWPIRFSTTSDPVQVKPGLWLAELQTAQAVELKPGDELAVRPNWVGAILRLALYRDEPSRGHGVTGQTFGTMGGINQPRLRLALRTEIFGSAEAGKPHEVRIQVCNPLPYAAEAVVDWKLADYFGSPVAAKQEAVRIEPHTVKSIVYPFVAQAAARAYQLDVKTRPAEGFQPPIARPVEMIELNDWAKLEFLPNLAGPLDDWNHLRRDLSVINAGGRMEWLLDGEDWDRGLFMERRVPATPPPNIQYGRFRVPYRNWWEPLPKNAFGMWYRKKFHMPEWMKGQTFQIALEMGGDMAPETTVFLNGRRMERLWGDGGYSSFSDVTSAIRPQEENELVILVRGPISSVKEAYVDLYNPDNGQENTRQQDFPGQPYNSGGMGSVRLVTTPDVRVRQTLVLPDVEKDSLVALNRVENRRAEPCTVELSYQVVQDGKLVKDAIIPSQTVSLKPGEVVEVRAQGRGTGLRPYTSVDPALAKLVTTLTVKGVTADMQEQRFGYRSVKVKDGSLNLNGQPLSVSGLTCCETGQRFFERENGLRLRRSWHVDRTDTDLWSELGIFSNPVVPYISVESWEQLNNEKLWERGRRNAVEVLWSEGSRPGNIGWTVSNESYHYACYSVGPDGQAKGAQRYGEVVQEVRDKVWPDFWFISDGNESLAHRLNFTSWHYLNQGWGDRYNLGAYGKPGIAHYPPDSFFVSGAANPPLADVVVHGTGADDWKPGMACGGTEEFWFNSEKNGPAIAKYIGDRAAVSTAWQFGSGRGMWWGKLSVEAYRDMGASDICIYGVNFLTVVMQNVTFALPQQEIRYYSGAAFEKRLNIHDVEFAPGKLEFTWKLVGPDGKTCETQTLKMDSTTSYLKRDRIAFNLPKVQERTSFVLDMELRKNGKLREHEQRTVDVWPAALATAKAAAPAETLALFDPEGKTQAVLERFGGKVKPISSLTAEALAGSRVLIVGPNCVTANMAAEQQVVRRFVEAGGRVLVLPQADSSLLSADTHVEKGNYASMGFVRAADHPVMKGLKDVDFAMWNPGHLIAKGLYRTPVRGNFLPLVECFHWDPTASVFTWSPLWEIYLGRGSIVATQLPLLEGLETEPMAAEMWRRLLDYLGKDVYRHPSATLAVLEGVSEPVLSRLREIRADIEIVQTLDAGPTQSRASLDEAARPGSALAPVCVQKSVAMVEMNRPDFSKQTETFRQYVRNGGTLILHRVRPEHQAWLADLTGRNVTVEVQPYRSWVDREMLQRHDGLAEGLNNVDFYWRANVPGEGGDSTCEVSSGLAEGKGQVEYVVRVGDATDYLFPGGWVEVSLGKGRIVLDQVKWEVPERDKNDYGSPMRVVSLLLNNLGVVQSPPSPKPALPKDVKLEPLNLDAVVNRGLVDEKSADGVGWLDWGPTQDLRDFPTGDINLGGVPFRVTPGAKNCVVLRVNPQWVKSCAELPLSATIPVNKKNVGGFWFLHTGGWSGGLIPFGRREIQYADGTKEAMMLNNSNFADWNYGHDQFPTEEGTTTTVAWKGACRMYPVTRVYMTLWVNPHPEKEVAAVVLTVKDLPPSEQGLRFLAHLAVTAAIMPNGAAPSAARDAKKSQTLLQEAMTLRQAKKDAQAAAKVEEALQADDQNAGAWTTLTEIHAASDGVDAFKAICGRWFQAMPKNYQAHNILGKYLETKGKPAEALAEYKKSLALEWNQPPITEAVKRLSETPK